MAAVAYSIWDNRRYVKVEEAHDGYAAPGARLVTCMIASIAIPVGLFWFAWTNYPSIHWIVCHCWCTLRLRNGARLSEYHELPDRRIHHLRSVRADRQLRPAFVLRCRVSPVYHLHVPESGYPLGVIDPRLLGPGLRALLTSTAQRSGSAASTPHSPMPSCASCKNKSSKTPSPSKMNQQQRQRQRKSSIALRRPLSPPTSQTRAAPALSNLPPTV